MPTFTSIDAIRDYILERSKVVVQEARDRVHKVFEEFLLEYYSEFTPEVYERTYQLLSSCVKTEVVSTGNGWTAEVYFDEAALDYSTKSLTKWPVDGGFMNPFNGDISSDGVFPNPSGDAGKTLNSAMHGSHGGYASGTAIWDEAMIIFKSQLYNILKSLLRANGIPVR